MKFSRAISTLISTLAITGCSLIPAYHRPASPVPSSWPTGSAYPQASQASEKMAADIGWQAFFQDPALRRLIGLAIDNNRDLRKAVLNVQAYRAEYRIQAAKMSPHVSAGASVEEQRLPGDVAISWTPGREDIYQVDLGMASYEVDFFGKIRSLSQQAMETYLATESAQRSAQIALVDAVATAYLHWRTDQQEAALTVATLESDQHSLTLIQRNAAAGIASQLSVRQAAVAVDHERAAQAADSRQVAQDVNALALLVGVPVPQSLPGSASLDEGWIVSLPVGLSSDVLLRRPDIRAAELKLLAANANIGAARAAFFPSITLVGAAGTTSGKLQNLFSPGQWFWSFTPQINVPIFTAGSLKASLDHAQIEKQINVAEYEKTIQTAFREVSDGLSARQTYETQYQAQRSLVENDEAYLSLARERFREGIATYLTVLDANRELLSARRELLHDRMARLTTEVSLYAALGGGLGIEEIKAKATLQR